MKLAQSYVEMLNSGINRPVEEGTRSYPSASMEIMLMDHAQRKAQSREAAVFRQLCVSFDWQLSRHQQNQYVQQLKRGYTLVLTNSEKVILWASHSFMGMTGYRVTEALGQKPAMLQGPATDSGTTRHIREKLGRAESVRADLINYRKDGSPYTCRVAIDPIHNTQGTLTHFLAVESEVA